MDTAAHIAALLEQQLRTDHWPANVSFTQLLPESQGFVLNVATERGAATYRTAGPLREAYDETLALLDAGFRGLFIEPQDCGSHACGVPAALARANSSGAARVVRADVTAEGIDTLLSGVPRELSALRVDTGAADLAVLRAVMRAGYRPLAICVHVNADVPPPLRWSVEASTSADANESVANFREGHGYSGASADDILAVAHAHHYSLVAWEFGRMPKWCIRCVQNAWLVRNDRLSDEARRQAASWRRSVRAFWAQFYALHVGLRAAPAQRLFASTNKMKYIYGLYASEAASLGEEAWGANATGVAENASEVHRQFRQAEGLPGNAERCALCFTSDPCPLHAVTHAPAALVPVDVQQGEQGEQVRWESLGGAWAVGDAAIPGAALAASHAARVSERLAELAGTSHWASEAFADVACSWMGDMRRRACAGGGATCPAFALGLTGCDAVDDCQHARLRCRASGEAGPPDAFELSIRPKRSFCVTLYNKREEVW